MPFRAAGVRRSGAPPAARAPVAVARLAAVLNDVAQSLRSLIQSAVPSNGGLPLISFAPPTAAWAADQDDPVINLFLYDVREDQDGLGSYELDIRDDDGKVIGRLPPPRRYQLSYLVSAWSKDPEAEHEMLGAILVTVPDDPALPAEHLVGRLVEQGLPVRIAVGRPVAGANTWDLWSALGSPPRTAIEIVVTAPIVPGLRTDLAPPAVKLDLGVTKEPPGAIGPEGELPTETVTAPEPAEGPKGRRKADKGAPAPELEARQGRRWTTFRVREQAVPTPPGD
ncbi:MAG: DUF4255 domain-containing protein [Acidimicrobiales bacterium]